MKKIYSILAIAGLISICGCDKMSEIDSAAEKIRMILRTDCAELITKATEKGEDKFNENRIQSIHYYFFDETSGTLVHDNAQIINKTGEADISLSGISSTIFNNIFSGRTELKVLVVANATTPDGTSTTTMDNIKSTAVTLSAFGKQDNFVMVGEGILTKTGANNAETSEISLKRLASKITLHLIVPDSFIDGAAKEWLPQMNAVQVDFNNLCKNTLVSGEEAPSTVLSNATRKSTSSDFTKKEILNETDLSLTVPVYSYPRGWSNGDEEAPYLYITLPWKMKTEATTADTYYKILLPGTSLDPNSWYDITARLGGLGSLVKEGTVTVKNLSVIVDKVWKDASSDGNDTDADLALPRVLVVENNKYIINNQNQIEIPFVSSHNCEVIDFSVDQDSHPTEMGVQKSSSAVVDNASRRIKFTHELLNDQSSKPYDYLIFKAHFTLRHSDDPNYSEVIYIEQRPALYIEPFDNAGGYRNVFVDKYQKTIAPGGYNTLYTGKYYQIGGRATNTNVYTVTASVLTGGFSSNKIGDPRIHEPVDFTVSPWKDLENWEQGNENSICGDQNKHLKYYYTSGSETSEFIAPSFRIGSAYAGTGSTSFSDPYVTYQMRCATYQEAGYPAGRWRLPTEAELKYCLQLQADGCLGDGIFYDDTFYICATKNVGYQINTSSGVNTIEKGNTPTNCRCVYDAWYWDNTSKPRLDESEYAYSECGDTDGNYKFCWGDQQIFW
ncbi:MAG: hypothetical protein KBT00_04365 [Bacteroidales bacterium]|nr:hypothetical protein [Candidatus Cacconaster merdequi]